MIYTAEQLAGFKIDVTRRRKRAALVYLLMSLPLYGLVFALAKGAALGLSRYQWLAISVAVVVAGQLLVMSLLRCPGCGAGFWLRQGAQTCLKCGLPIGHSR